MLRARPQPAPRSVGCDAARDHAGRNLAALAIAMLCAALAGCQNTPLKDRVDGAVGRIFCTQGGDLSVGTGFALTPQYVITAAHVIRPGGRPCDVLEIAFEAGGRQSLELVDGAIDLRRDLALARVHKQPGQELVVYGGYASLDGETLGVIGFPLIGDPRRSDSEQYVKSSIDRPIVSRVIHDADNVLTLQLTKALESGQSGGPTFDACGRVVGVAIRVRRGVAVSGQTSVLHARELLTFLEGLGNPDYRPLIETDACQPPLRAWLWPGILGVSAVAGLLSFMAALALRVRNRELLAAARRAPAAPNPAPDPRSPSPARLGSPSSERPITPEDAMRTVPVQWRVRFVSGPLIGQDIALLNILGLGRDPDFSALRFPATSTGLSRKHAELRLYHGVVEIRDLGSSGGTHVAGQAIQPHAWVSVDSGVRVTLGTEISLVVEEQ